jgi:hypothetical protein
MDCSTDNSNHNESADGLTRKTEALPSDVNVCYTVPIMPISSFLFHANKSVADACELEGKTW